MKLIILHGLGQTVASYGDLKKSLTNFEVGVGIAQGKEF